MRRARWIVLAALLAAMVAVGLGIRSGAPGYRRFVSRPLPDGTRYTFLYPRGLRLAHEDAGQVRLCRFRPATLQSWFRSLTASGDPEPWETVAVEVIPYVKAYP